MRMSNSKFRPQPLQIYGIPLKYTKAEELHANASPFEFSDVVHFDQSNPPLRDLISHQQSMNSSQFIANIHCMTLSGSEWPELAISQSFHEPRASKT